jgi:hypothetical protein
VLLIWLINVLYHVDLRDDSASSKLTGLAEATARIIIFKFNWITFLFVDCSTCDD